MAIQILFDSANNVKSPTMVLTYRSGKSIGAILPHNLHYSESLNACNEMSFDVYKDINGVECQYWSNIKDFRLVYCVEWDEYFEIYVEIDEADETIKHIQGRSLSEAELSQIKVYGLEVNTELDISREDYRPTIIYSSDEEISLIHKLLEKTPNFEIEHVDISIAKLQRTFTFDDKTVYDALQEVSEEVKCLIEFKSKKGSDGKIKRSISIYDLSSFCEECGHRNIDGDVCPKYEDQESAHAVYKGKNINPGFGEDTSIFVSRKKLTDNITYSSDVDSVKNCFKLTAGDDLMTATVRNCSPSKSGYLWHFTQEMMSDMSSELRAIIGQYQAAYDQYNTQFKDGDIDYGTEWEGVLLRYNKVCNKYKPEYSCPNKFTNYLDIMNTYYNIIDLELYLRSSMMPSVDLEDLTNKDQAETHISTISGSHTVYLQNITNLNKYSAMNAIESYLRTVVDPKFQIKLTQSSFDNNVWKGMLTLVSYSNGDDIGTKNIIVSFSNDKSGYTKQKLETSLAKTKAETPDIIELYSIGSNAKEETQKFENFKTEIGKYGLVPLTRLRDAGQACLNILIEMGIGGDKANTLWLLNWKDENNDLYNSLYIPYYDRVTELNKEIKERQEEIDDVVGKFDTNGHLVEHGMMSYLENIVSELQEKLDLEGYINTYGGSSATELLKELVSFRREDTYKNDNFISEGLDNAQVFSRALEFVAEADKDIRAAAVPIHTISSTLKNLLVMKEFKGIVDKFKVGNWIRAEIDSEIFKLRLIRYDIGFDDINNIQVEFSDVQSVKDSMADIQSILNQASSIAGNYSNIKIEVDNNKKAGDYVWEWVNDGLALTKMKIVDDAENQNIYWDENGFLCREYSPVMDAYEDKQLKIINKGLYLTDDNWMTTRAGIGNFIYYDPKASATSGESVYKESYGVIADTLVGNLILSKEIGIYNEGNSIQMDSNGFIMTINPEDKSGYNVFTIQKKTDETDDDGNRKYDKLFNIDDDGNLCIKGHIYATSIELGSGVTNEDLGIDLSGLLSKSDASNTYVTKTGYNTKVEEIEQAIAGIKNGNGSYIEQIGQIADNVVFFATAYGDAKNGYYYNGNFYKDYINGAYENLIMPYNGRYYYDISSGKGYKYNGTYPNGAYSETGIPGKTFAIKKDGSLIATDAVIKGTVYATDGEFFGSIKSGLKTDGQYNFDATSGEIKIGRKSDGTYSMTVHDDGTIELGKGVTIDWNGVGQPSGGSDPNPTPNPDPGSGSTGTGSDSGTGSGSTGTTEGIDPKLLSALSLQFTKFGDTYTFTPNILGGQLLIGNQSGVYAQITNTGKLIANGAELIGSVSVGASSMGGYNFIADNTSVRACHLGGADYNFVINNNGTLGIGKNSNGTYNFQVDSSGNVTVRGTFTVLGGSTGDGNNSSSSNTGLTELDVTTIIGNTVNTTYLNGKDITAKYVTSGYIKSDNYAGGATFDASSTAGTFIDLYNGKFNLGGKLIYNGTSLTLDADLAITWSDITDAPSKSDLVTADNVTKITSSAISTATIAASQISTGTIASANPKNTSSYDLYSQWDLSNGEMTFKKLSTYTTKILKIGCFKDLYHTSKDVYSDPAISFEYTVSNGNAGLVIHPNADITEVGNTYGGVTSGYTSDANKSVIIKFYDKATSISDAVCDIDGLNNSVITYNSDDFLTRIDKLNIMTKGIDCLDINAYNSVNLTARGSYISLCSYRNESSGKCSGIKDDNGNWYIHPSTKDGRLVFGNTTQSVTSNNVEYLGYSEVVGGVVRLGTSETQVVSLNGVKVTFNGTTIHGSDRRYKDNIECISEEYDELFMSLKPKSFTFKSDYSNVTHMGFIAQEVRDSIITTGLPIDKIALFSIHDKNENGEDMYGLAYNEFIALNTHMIQKCLKEIDALKSENETLKQQILDIKQAI